jgi:transposase
LDGRRKSEVSQIFNISRNTIDLWLKCKAETGDLKPKHNRPPGNNHKSLDWEKFREFAKTHGDKTHQQMAQLWDGDISSRTISRTLCKIGFTRKKTYGYQERDEAKRQAFLEQIATIDPYGIVYADKAGMDTRDNYGYG